MDWPFIFLVSFLILECLVGLVVLIDIRADMDLQRRLRGKRERG